MQYRALVATNALRLSILGGLACDGETVAESPAQAPVQAQATLDNRVDLQAVVDVVASGEVESAVELEGKLEADAMAHVDLDLDGKRDPLRIVERREETKTVFEVRALPSSKVEVELETAPTVAVLEIEAKADAGVALAKASYSASFAATAKVDASTTFEHTFTGVSFSTDGKLVVAAEANAFVGWAFHVGRPVYVATVFVVADREPVSDPCWPPGHCKHGHWKATGEMKPGHAKKADGHAHGAGELRGEKKKHGKHASKDKGGAVHASVSVHAGASAGGQSKTSKSKTAKPSGKSKSGKSKSGKAKAGKS